MPAPNVCLSLIDEAAAGKFSDDELDSILTTLSDIVESREARQDLTSLQIKLDEVGETLISRAEKRRLQVKEEILRAVIISKDLVDMSAEAFKVTGDASMGLRAAMGGVNAPFFGSRASVDSNANGIAKNWIGGLFTELHDNGLMPAFNRVADEDDIIAELYDVQLDKPRGNVTKNTEARAVAKLLDKWQRVSFEREVRAGAPTQLRQGRITRTTWDAGLLIKMGRKDWMAREKGRINWEVMKVKADKIDGVMRDIYRDITTGGRVEQADLGFALDPKINIAKRAAASRRVVWNSAADWSAHNKEFGFRSFKEALLLDFRVRAQNVALLDMFGARPNAMLDRVRGRLKEIHADDPKQIKNLDAPGINNLMRELDGSVNIDQGGMHFYNSAGFGRSTRAVLSMAKLGFSAITSLGDPLFGAAANRRIYGGLWAPHVNAFNAVFKGLTSAQTKRLSRRLLVGFDTQLGEVMQRYHAQDNLSGVTANLMRLYFKYNLLGPWTDANKRGIGVMRANELGDLAKKPFDQLSKDWQRYLTRFRFDAKRWEVARAAVILDEGRRFMFPDEVRNARGTAALAGLSERQQIDLLDEVQTSLSSLYADAVDSATPTPGARERAILRQGSAPGDITGEAWRYFAQLKGFPVTISTKILGPIFFDRGQRTLSESFFKGQFDVVGLASVIAGTTIMGAISTQLQQLVQLREPLPWDAKLLMQGFIKGGAGGLYADFLFAENDRPNRSFLASLGGPLASELNTAARLLAQAQAGQDIRAGSIRFARGVIPGQNLFYTKALLDYLIFFQLQEIANPGYLRRMEDGFKSSRGQGFLIPPSRVIPRGGGGLDLGRL